MHNCSYIMCDGYECSNVGTVCIGGEWYCTEHSEAIKTGIDPMFENEMNNFEIDIDF